jgi:signal transduction histidine kinase
MKSGKLYNSAAFRLTMLYILTFGASVSVLLVIIYSTITAELDRQLKYDINIQLADLGRTFIREGLRDTTATIQHLIEKDREGNQIFLLLDSNWEKVAGNLDKWPGGSIKPAEWITFTVDRTSASNAHKAVGINSSLPRGYILLVGRKLAAQEKIRSLISNILFICFGITAILAAAGGLLMSLTISRRLEQVSQVCETVMQGKLQTRVVVSGSADEFDHLAENINRMLQRIEELIGGVRDISYNVAHDLRTPLNRLRNRVEYILHQDMSLEEQEHQLRTSLQEIDDLVATFNSILRISQAEIGAGIEHFLPCDISQILINVLELYRPVAEEKAITEHSDVVSGAWVLGDRHLLSQAFANIFDNAIKYSPSESILRVSLSVESDKVVIVVADNGPGIPPEFYDKITDKFFRLESSRSTPGNGLGLSLVNAAIKLHRGEIHFSDNQPGLIVTITLPLAESATVA